MKPNTIFLIRHGQSEGNADKQVYKNVPDYAVKLTEMGKVQSKIAGNELLTMINTCEKTAVYYSPFFRTIETLNNIAKSFPSGYFDKRWVREEPRLREQEWSCRLSPNGFDFTQERERFCYGHFYYRFDGGESCADVYDRVSDFMDTLHRDFQKKDYPQNVLMVTHGMTLRLFIMRWFHKTVHEFEQWENPKNCEIFILRKNDADKYDLLTPFGKTKKNRHEYVCELEM